MPQSGAAYLVFLNSLFVYLLTFLKFVRKQEDLERGERPDCSTPAELTRFRNKIKSMLLSISLALALSRRRMCLHSGISGLTFQMFATELFSNDEVDQPSNQFLSLDHFRAKKHCG
jgi:hypothetical protein